MLYYRYYHFNMNFAKTTAWITVLLVIGYVFSFAKESVIANYFGVSLDVDAYNIAIQIPVIIFAFVAVAVKSVVIPLYSDIYYNQSPKSANRFANSFVTLNILIAFGFILVGELFSDLFISIFAPGFNDEAHTLAVELLRITLPTMAFTVVTDIVTGILNVHRKLVLPCFAVYFLNGVIIIVLVLCHGIWGIKAACVGQVLGSLLQMLYLVLISNQVYRVRLSFNFKIPEIKKAVKLSGPVIWGISIAEVNAIVNRVVGSFLFIGSISALSYAGKLNTVFMTFCTQAISIIVYPLYAESSAKKDVGQLSRRINFTLSVYSAMLVPLMCLIFVFRKEIVEIAFARGAFDDKAVMLTQGLLGCYTIGLLFSAFRETLTKVFYSLHDTATVAKNATLGVLLNIGLNLSLPFVFGVEGLALAASFSAIFISIRLLWKLKRLHSEIELSAFYANLKSIMISSLVMGTLLWFGYTLGKGYSTWLLGAIEAIVSVVVYMLCLWITKAPVLKEVCKFIK